MALQIVIWKKTFVSVLFRIFYWLPLRVTSQSNNKPPERSTRLGDRPMLLPKYIWQPESEKKKRIPSFQCFNDVEVFLYNRLFCNWKTDQLLLHIFPTLIINTANHALLVEFIERLSRQKTVKFYPFGSHKRSSLEIHFERWSPTITKVARFYFTITIMNYMSKRYKPTWELIRHLQFGCMRHQQLLPRSFW